MSAPSGISDGAPCIWCHLVATSIVVVMDWSTKEPTLPAVTDESSERQPPRLSVAIVGICGAAETVLVDRQAAAALIPPVVNALTGAGCEVRGDEAVQELASAAKAADEQDWHTEYLDAVISIRVVDELAQAVEHIRKYGSGHTESIVAEDKAAAEEFLAAVDSAIVLHNASTQYADGGEFGMGAEIGIATGRIHARGPVGAEQLTSYKYIVRGSGQTRP